MWDVMDHTRVLQLTCVSVCVRFAVQSPDRVFVLHSCHSSPWDDDWRVTARLRVCVCVCGSAARAPGWSWCHSFYVYIFMRLADALDKCVYIQGTHLNSESNPWPVVLELQDGSFISASGWMRRRCYGNTCDPHTAAAHERLSSWTDNESLTRDLCDYSCS